MRLPRLDFRDREVAKRQRMLSRWLATPRTQRGLGIAVTDTLRAATDAEGSRQAYASGSQTARGATRVVDSFGFAATELAVNAPVPTRVPQSPRRALKQAALSSSGKVSHSQSFSSSFSSTSSGEYSSDRLSPMAMTARVPHPPPRAATASFLPQAQAVA